MRLSVTVISFRIDVIDSRSGAMWRAEEQQEYVTESGKSNTHDDAMSCII